MPGDCRDPGRQEVWSTAATTPIRWRPTSNYWSTATSGSVGLNAEELALLASGGRIRAAIVVFVEFVAKGADADAQYFGSVRAIAFALVESGEDVSLFHFA